MRVLYIIDGDKDGKGTNTPAKIRKTNEQNTISETQADVSVTSNKVVWISENCSAGRSTGGGSSNEKSAEGRPKVTRRPDLGWTVPILGPEENFCPELSRFFSKRSRLSRFLNHAICMMDSA